MHQKRSVILAWVLGALCVAGAITQAILWLLQLTAIPSFDDLGEVFVWGLAMVVAFAVPAALIIARQPGNRVGWLMMLPALAMAMPAWVLTAVLSTPPAALTPGLWLLILVDGWSWTLVMFPIFLIPLHFPTGRPPSPRWEWVNGMAIGMWLFFTVMIAFLDVLSPLNGEWTVPNPVGFIPLAFVEGPFLIVWGIGLVMAVALSVASLFVRYRRAQAIERQQIKWLLYASALFVVVYPLTFFFEAWGLAFVLSILAIPAAIGIAILRYRLYDIDIIIRRTLIFGMVTGMLTAVYFGSVILLQNVFQTIRGQQSQLSIILSTLLIAGLFSPMRRRVQDFIDRRFYRRKYNAEKTLEAFATVARDTVDLEQLAAELLKVVEETMQPENASLWLNKR